MRSSSACRRRSLTALQYAAEGGHPVAQWKLGRMYADGDGVDARRSARLRLFQQHRQCSTPRTARRRRKRQIVANAFVALGRYYLDGIPNTRVKADPERAREMFPYAASYFGNADAQYNLARMYLDGVGAPRDPKYAARWLALRPRRRASIRRRPCLARCCSTAIAAAAGRARPDVADAGAATAPRRTRPGSRTSTRPRCQGVARTTAPWPLQMLERWVQGRAGLIRECSFQRLAWLISDSRLTASLRSQIDPDRNVV